jgi:hypothetical protein
VTMSAPHVPGRGRRARQAAPLWGALARWGWRLKRGEAASEPGNAAPLWESISERTGLPRHGRLLATMSVQHVRGRRRRLRQCRPELGSLSVSMSVPHVPGRRQGSFSEKAAPKWESLGEHERAARAWGGGGEAGNAAPNWESLGEHERAARAWEAAGEVRQRRPELGVPR